MSAATFLESLGLTLELTATGNLALEGLKRLSQGDREYALAMAREHKPAILEELKRRSAPDAPTPEQIAHARRMLVACPVQGRKLHCWYCSRCTAAAGCKAWLPLRGDVEFFRQSGEPFSLFVAEGLDARGPVQ